MIWNDERETVKISVSYTHLDVYKRQEHDWRLVIPEGLVDKIIWDCHIRYGHFGARKCVNVLKESCLFKNMERRVRTLLRECDLCQKSKVVNYRLEGEMRCIIVEKPVSYTHLKVESSRRKLKTKKTHQVRSKV